MLFYGNDPVPAQPAYTPVDYDLQARTARAQAEAIALKLSMRDPDSFKVHTVITDARGKTVCIAYQARNGFGGMNQGEHIAVDGLSKETWSPWCTGPGMFSMTASVR